MGMVRVGSKEEEGRRKRGIFFFLSKEKKKEGFCIAYQWYEMRGFRICFREGCACVRPLLCVEWVQRQTQMCAFLYPANPPFPDAPNRQTLITHARSHFTNLHPLSPPIIHCHVSQNSFFIFSFSLFSFIYTLLINYTFFYYNRSSYLFYLQSLYILLYLLGK